MVGATAYFCNTAGIEIWMSSKKKNYRCFYLLFFDRVASLDFFGIFTAWDCKGRMYIVHRRCFVRAGLRQKEQKVDQKFIFSPDTGKGERDRSRSR
jgi:hypothetical protein